MLHENFIVHRSIAPQNIVWEWRNDKPHIYLTDFSGSGYVPDRQHELKEGWFMQPGFDFDYIPPGEAIAEYDGLFPNDVWAVGIILTELVSFRF